MSASVNKVILIGNLGQAPEVKNTQTGEKIVTLSLATTESWKDKASGEKKQKVEWHRVVIFNDAIANAAAVYLKKGSKVYIEGQLQTHEWMKDDVKHYTTQVIITKFKGSMVMLGSNAEKNDEPVISKASLDVAVGNDEIPF